MVRNLKVRNLNLVTFIILNTDLCAFDMKHPQITFCIRILKEATLTNTTHSLYFEPIRAEIRAMLGSNRANKSYRPGAVHFSSK